MTDDPALEPTTGEKAFSERHKHVGLRSARWVLVLAGILGAITLVWHIRRLQELSSRPALADSELDFSTCLVPRDQIVSAAPIGSIPALPDNPPMLSTQDAKAFRMGHGKLLVKGDPVIGVALRGEARAYPIRLLDFHEVVNDTIAGVPVAITWSPLSGSALVFRRRIGETRHSFVASGALFNSSQLLTSRQEPTSLWSQLQARALVGPAVARAEVLPLLPFKLMHWSDWLSAHPKTQVLQPAPELMKAYKTYPYRNYQGSDLLRFPVSTLPPPGLKKKAPVLAVRAGGERRVYPLSLIEARADAAGIWTVTQGGVTLTFQFWAGYREDDPPTAIVDAPKGTSLEVVPSYWFAWFATHPGDATLAE